MNSNHIKKVKEEIKNLFDNSDIEITAVSFGYKSVNNLFTNEKCIRFGVIEKKPLSELDPKKIIPKNIIIDGVSYKTDVFQCGIPHIAIYHNSENNSGNFQSMNFDYTKCRPWRLKTDVPGTSFDYFTLSNVCGNRNLVLPVKDGESFCFDNDHPPVNGDGYKWEPDDTLIDENGMPYPCLVIWKCNAYFAYNFDGTPTEGFDQPLPIKNHRTLKRPLVGGISMINLQKEGDYTAATLGGIVIDTTDNKLVGLTNSHVSGTPSYLNNGDRTPYMLASDKLGGLAKNYDNIQNVQPSYSDNWSESQNSNLIGTTKRIYPLKSDDYNYIDCAIVNLSNEIVDVNSWKPMSSTFTSPPVFATTQEIDSLTPTTPVFLSGRTSGPVGTEVVPQPNLTDDPDNLYWYETSTNITCDFIISSTMTSVNVGYTPTLTIAFTDQIVLEGKYPCHISPTRPGDSGSVLYAKINNVWKIVGLIFAGNEWSGIGLANRIDHVANLIKIREYTGTTVNADPNTPNYIELPFDEYANKSNITYNGKTYWQVGIVS